MTGGMRSFLPAALLFALCAPTAMADSASDSFLQLYAETGKFLLGRPNHAKLTPDGKAALFLRAQPKSPVQTLFELNVATGEARELLTPEKVLKGAEQTLSVEEKARLERLRVSARGLTHYELSKDGALIAVTLSGRLYVVERVSGEVLAVNAGEGVLDPQFSPDGKHIAYVRDYDLYAVELKTNQERRLTRGGSERLTHGLPEFVAQEEMSRFRGYWWSPDSKLIAFEESDTREVEQLAIVDVMKPEKGSTLFAYPRPGKANAKVRLGLVSAAAGVVRWASWDSAKYPYLCSVSWQKGGPLSILVQNRAQQEEVLLAVDALSGATRELLTERDEAWLNLKQDFPHWLEDGSGFLWHTERNGGSEIELRGPKGEKLKTWVKPSAGFGSFAGFDLKTRTLYFTGSPNPTEQVLHRVREDAEPERLTAEPAWQEADLSTDGSVLVVSTTSVRQMPRIDVLSPQGEALAALPSIALEPPFLPQVEIQKVGPGEGLWTAVIRPREQAAAKGKKPAAKEKDKKLPVILEVYGGPHHQEVKQTAREYLLSQWYADQGYVVVKVDGRGTPRRGRAWERAIRGDFATATLEDQVAGLHALGEKVPELDLSRVGVQGWSFGGYMAALSVLRRPDVFRTGVAGAPVVDWRDYDTFYTERYLGLPDELPKAYEVSSLLTYAQELSRPLLIVHGTADDNVYFFHSLKLSNALFRAGKQHELLALSGLTHMVPEPVVTQRLHQRIADQFRAALKSPAAVKASKAPKVLSESTGR